MGKGRYHDASNKREEGGNSQTCLCGCSVPKKLSERWHSCPECGLQGPRDQISAIICQYETYGSLPDISKNSLISKMSTPGLGVGVVDANPKAPLEHAAEKLKARREAALVAKREAEALLKKLATGRGENKGRKGEKGKTSEVNGESHAAESINDVQDQSCNINVVITPLTSEFSENRPIHEARSIKENTTGEVLKTASVEVKTTGHVDYVNTCPVETKNLLSREQPTAENTGVIGITEMHPRSCG
jgi:hypothetical protein